MAKAAFLSFSIFSTLFLSGGDVAGKSFFVTPPTKISIHNPASIEGRRNKTTISVAISNKAGVSLSKIILTQLPSINTWVWSSGEPTVYLGAYSLRKRGNQGLASMRYSAKRKSIELFLNQEIYPGQQVNIVLRGYNPNAGIYQWSTRMIPSGIDPVPYNGPILRLSVYKSDYSRGML